MMRNLKIRIQQSAARVDWKLLVFLLLFMQVKLAGKLLGIAFLYLTRFKLSFRFSAKWPGIPLFYPAMILIGLADLLLYRLYNQPHYLFLLGGGFFFWVLCMLAFQQLSLSVAQVGLKELQFTILVFFLINAAASFYNIIAIIAETGVINPYRYQGNYQKYFIGTGDYIKGITFDTSTTNAIINAIGVVYFLFRRQMLMSLLCMVVLLLASSNFMNLVVLCCLAGMFFFQSDRNQKSIVVIHLMLLVVFMTSVSPQNNRYSLEVFARLFTGKAVSSVKQVREIPVEERPDSLLNAEQQKFKHAKLYLDSLRRLAAGQPGQAVAAARPEIPKANIHGPEYQHRQDSSAIRKSAMILLAEIEKDKGVHVDTSARAAVSSGKLIAYRQLAAFMRDHPGRLATGNGIGNFSSKIAFRAAEIGAAGSYPASQSYIHPDFRNNHLATYLVYASKDSGFHSITNLPYSFYGQLIGEYGLIGLGCFLIFYLGYFARSIRPGNYAIPVLFIMIAAFATDYWFEHLSVVVLFELLMLLNIKEFRAMKAEGS